MSESDNQGQNSNPTDDADESTATNGVRPDGDAHAAALIGDVAALVNSDRDSHGDAVAQQEAAATAWTWYLGIHDKLQAGTQITGADVARLMTLLKISRGGIGAYDIDHDRDGVGYMGIAGACAVSEGAADRDELTRGDGEQSLRTDGGGFDITLDRTFVRADDGPEEVWKASVDNADAYNEVGSSTASGALHALAQEFRDKFRESGVEPTEVDR